MPRTARLSDLFTTAAVALLAGLVGGLGGRRFAARALAQDLADLGDEVHQLGRRVSRREGWDGAERKRRAHDDLEDRVAALDEQERQPQVRPQPLTREQLTAAGFAIFGNPNPGRRD
jgi:hypothetical protein